MHTPLNNNRHRCNYIINPVLFSYKVLKTVCERGIQNGMHKTFSFPIHCESPQVKPDSVEVRNVNGEVVIFASINPPDSHAFEAYDVFDKVEIIPSLVKMVEKIKNGGNKKKEIKKWVKEWGLLKGSLTKNEFDQYEMRQSIDSFWREAEKLYDLWNLHKHTVNRDLESIKKHVQKKEKIYDSHTLNTDFIHDEESGTYLFFSESESKVKVAEFFLFSNKDYKAKEIAIWDESEELVTYQYICMHYILNQIEEHVSKGILRHYWLKRDSYQEKDYFKIEPILTFNNLLDALYMQLFILMTENEKKICPVCEHPFTPERKDKKYCSETCYLTAKSRRYRARKNAAM